MPSKIALVTGANGGLGTYVTKALLEADYTVVGLAPRIQQSDFDYPNFTALPAQITSLDSAQKAINDALARFKKIDVLAHLVGGFAGGQTIAETDGAVWQSMFEANVNTAFYLFRAVIPAMRKAGSGRIIAIASCQAEFPAPTIGAYSASKAALVSLVKTIALENKDANITANSILPATIATPANRKAMPGADTSQWVEPASIAGLIVWLASDAAKDVTGAAIPVYGKSV